MFRGVLQNHRAETIHSALIFLEADMKGKTHEETHEIWNQMRVYKAEGHTNREVAEMFGCTTHHAQRICAGIAPQQVRLTDGRARNQYTSGRFDREQNARNKIQQYIPDFEYVGGFTSMDGSVDIKCKTCGNVITRSFISIRHNHVACTHCKEQERHEREAEAEHKRAERLRIAEERHKAKEQAWEEKHRPRRCATCGAITTRPKYCSNKCCRRANQQKKDATRRLRERAGLVDRDITLEKLFSRDKGMCYLCGASCDWEDFEIVNGFYVAGDMYPSIDHVKPLSAGGTHAWDNVKLAHRGCNTKKSNTYTPLM